MTDTRRTLTPPPAHGYPPYPPKPAELTPDGLPDLHGELLCRRSALACSIAGDRGGAIVNLHHAEQAREANLKSFLASRAREVDNETD
jgi:hypothetical protein